MSERSRAVAVAGALVALLVGRRAHAQAYPPITDRDFALDLYTGAALGSVRIVGMGGTSVAVSEGSAGTLANPADAAVRRTTSHGRWDWDFHLDALRAVYASDFDHNGVDGDADFGTRIDTAGIAGMLDGWGLAVTGVTASAPIQGASGDDLEARTLATKVALARELRGGAWTVGVALRLGDFELRRAVGGPLFSLGGAGLEAGTLWRPPGRRWRAGATIAFPVTGDAPSVAGCDPMDCDGYILPARVVVPWQLAAGVAWRRAPTPWNQPVAGDFLDERALLLAADLVITGATPDGYGLEAFGAGLLQPSGRHVAVGVRAGAEYEWLPGRLRVRGGSYWEPERFTGVGGRLHGTVGVEVALWHFGVWRWHYRLRLSVTGDVASHYGNAGVSVGFWH